MKIYKVQTFCNKYNSLKFTKVFIYVANECLHINVYQNLSHHKVTIYCMFPHCLSIDRDNLYFYIA